MKILIFDESTGSENVHCWWVNLVAGALDSYQPAHGRDERSNEFLDKYNARTYFKRTSTGYERYLTIKSEEDFLALKLAWL